MEKESALWRKVSPEEKSEILKQAKSIMDNFANALKAVEKKVPESRVERDEFERQEQEPANSDSEFREIMFKNAPAKKGECIEAEKGGWT